MLSCWRKSNVWALLSILVLAFAAQASASDLYYIGPSESVVRYDTETGATEVIAQRERPYGLALAGDWCYYADPYEGCISRVRRDGTGAEDFLTGLAEPHCVATDANGEWLFWTSSGTFHSDGRILRVRIATGAVEEVASLDVGLPCGIAFDPTSGRLFWADSDYGTVSSAFPDGTGRQTVYSDSASYPFAIAVDSQAGRLYWSDRRSSEAGGNAIMTAALDGSDLRVAVSGVSQVEALAVDSTAGRLYWPTSAYEERIMSAALDGSDPHMFPNDHPHGNIDGIALDAATGRVFWSVYTTSYGSFIHSADLNGTNRSEVLATKLHALGQLSLDLADDKIYWIAADGQDDNRVGRMNLDGSGLEVLLDNSTPGVMDVDVDPSSGKIYWAEFHGQCLNRANLDGTNIETLAVYEGWWRPISLTLDIAAGKVYWVAWNLDQQQVMRANVDGSNPECLFTAGLGELTALNVDPVAGKIYWSDIFARSVRRANLDGTAPEDLTELGAFTARSLALSAGTDELYLALNAPGSSITSRIVILDLNSGATEMIMDHEYLGFHGLALDTGGDVDKDGDTDMGDFFLLQNAHAPSKQLRLRLEALSGPAGQHH